MTDNADKRLLIIESNIELPGGVLNFEAAAKSAYKRSARDFEEATQKLAVAEIGLREVYDHDSPEFSLRYLRKDNPTLDEVDSAVLWTRDSIMWLSDFSQRDQTYSVSISLKTLLTSQQFTAFAEGDEVDFHIPFELFERHTHVRLRGISASYYAPTLSPLPIILTLKVPSEALYYRARDSSYQIKQKNFPACTLGRVMNFTYPREPELCGTISLMNASPIGDCNENGKWRVSAKLPSTLHDMTDVMVECRLIGQPMTDIINKECEATSA